MSERTPQEAVIEAVKTSRDDLNAIRCSRTCGHASCVAAARIVLAVDALIASEQEWRRAGSCVSGPNEEGFQVFRRCLPDEAAAARVCSLLNRASRASDG